MDSSVNFDLKEKLDNNFTDLTTLNSLCKNIASENQRNEKLQCFASEIASGSMKLYTFMETLGSYTTDENVLIRKKGVAVLSSVLSQLPQNYLNESELHFIAMFYCDKLKDHKVVPSVLNGILAIVNMSHLLQDSLLSLLRSIFEHIQCQSELVQERRNIYLIFKTLIENRLDDLKSMGPDLIDGIISTVDGERDPHNLMLLFSILPYIIKKFPLGHLTEEMFAVVACYFPVDFNPSGRENLNLTREDLMEKLAPCLYATSEFVDYCIPVIIEKLHSTHQIAKLDSLHLLRDSVQTFGALRLQRYLYELWTALRKELIPVKDVDIADAALEAITFLIKIISTNKSSCKDFVDKIIADTKSSLCDVRLSLYRPSERLLETIATINKEICIQVMLAVIPICIGQYSTNISWDDKTELIETLNGVMKICSDHGLCIQDIPELRWTNVPQMYLDGLTVENIKLRSKMFLGLVVQKSYVNEIQRSILYNIIYNQIETECDTIHTVCHTTVLEFATLYPQEVTLFVKERFLLNTNEMTVELLKRRIRTLLAVAKLRELACVILPEIVTMLTNVDTDISITILLNIQKLIASGKSDFNIHQFLYEKCHIIDKLILYKTDFVDHKMLICNICQLIIRNLTAEEQRTIVMKYAVALNAKSSKTDMAMIMNILIPLRKDVNLYVSDDMIENLCNLAIINHNPQYTRQIACKFLSVLLNKIEIGDLDRIVSYLEEKISSNLEANNDVELEHVVDLQIRMTKALIMRGSGKSQDVLKNLMHLLTHDRVGRYVSQQYQILVSNHEDVLVKENFCDIKILYKQKIFEHLLQQNSNFVNSMRQNYLIALVHLLEKIPKELKFLHLAELVPLLIESLSLNDMQLVLWALRSLKSLINTKHDVLSNNIQCIILRLLQLTTEEIMDIRIAALECLTHYASYPTVLIYPYKVLVLDNLGIVIDDRKRLVRKAAVEARIRWFIVGVFENSESE